MFGDVQLLMTSGDQLLGLGAQFQRLLIGGQLASRTMASASMRGLVQKGLALFSLPGAKDSFPPGKNQIAQAKRHNKNRKCAAVSCR